MAGVNRAEELNALLKNVYENRKPENLQNMEAVTFSKLPVSSTKPTGNGFYGAVTASGNQAGLKAQNELEALATADFEEVKQFNVTPKVITNTCQFSGLVLEVGGGNAELLADALTLNLDNGLMNAEKEMNQQLFRSGDGIIARVNGAVSSSTTVPFDGGVPTHFRVDTPVDVFDSAGGAKQVSGVKISDIDISNKTITLASAQTCDDDGYIYRKSVNDNAPTAGKEISGLPLITDDGTDSSTYEGITRSGSGYVPAWKGLEIDASSANLSDDLLQRAFSQMKVYSGHAPKAVISNTSQFRKYLSLTAPQIQYDRPSENAPARDSGVKINNAMYMGYWNGMPWYVDTDCGFDEVYLVNFDMIEKFEVSPLAYDTKGGGILKWNTGYDSYIAYAKYYGNVGTRNPRAAAIRVHTLAEPTF